MPFRINHQKTICSGSPLETKRSLLGGSALVFLLLNATGALAQDVTVSDENERGEVVVDTIYVYGKKIESSAATRTATPIIETPVSIQIVPEQIVKDQGAIRLRDIYRNISGVAPAFTGSNVGTTEVPIIRGFQDNQINRNGFRLRNVAPVDFANINRVEVLKGPASVLFGVGEPGGLLNIITKTPQSEQFAVIKQEIGSFDRYRTTLDINSPLTNDGSLLGRVNFAYTSDNTFRDHDGIDRIFVAPTLEWRPGDVTSLVLEFSYSTEKLPLDHGLAFNVEAEPIADISTFLGEPDFRSERKEILAGYTFTHEISDNLVFRNMFTFQRYENRLNSFRHFSVNADNTVNRELDRTAPTATSFLSVADLQYDFELGRSRHNLMVGVDFRRDPGWGNTQQGRFSTGPFPIDTVNPRYNQFGAVVFDDGTDSVENRTRFGVFAQDQIHLFDDRLHLLLGARFDFADQSIDFECCGGFTVINSQEISAFTFRGAALYEVTDWISPYINISQSFNPADLFFASLDELDPEEGLGIEGGIKLSFLDGRVTSTLAGYQITKDNVPVADLENPGFSINAGELRSRGFELDIAGELAPGWLITASYAYTDTEVIESDFLPIGSRFRNVPLHSGNIWSSYDFQSGSGLDGFGIGAGVNGVSDRLGGNAGSFDLEGFVIANMAAWYRTELNFRDDEVPIKLQLNVQNLFDKEYYENSNSIANIFPGAPRTFLGSISVEF